MVQEVKDLRRSIDYLQTRPDIDGQKIAYLGMSWGAYMGSIIPAVEDRLRASVLIAGGILGLARPEASEISYVSRVQTPTLMLNGKYDVIFPPETSSGPMFDLLGTPPDKKRHILYETDHIPPRAEYIKETLAWLDKYLGPVK
jgi:dipeptidyl aminopeptidase/acylaminoacyl peptidase